MRGGAGQGSSTGDVARGYSLRHRGADNPEHSREPMDNLRTLHSLTHAHIMNATERHSHHLITLIPSVDPSGMAI
ncbi:hypothetical protein GCM10009636_00640 [Arthrobacter koreensis]